MKINKDNYRALAILAIIALFLSSCMVNRKGELTQKGINFIANHCKGFDSTTTNTEVIFKDTTIYITEVGEPIYLQSPCDSVAPIIKVKNGIKSTVLSVGKTKVFICEADSLKAVLKLMERKLTVKNNAKVVIQAPCNLDHVSGTQWAFIRIAQWFLIFIGVQLIIKIFISVYPVTRPLIGWAYLFKF